MRETLRVTDSFQQKVLTLSSLSNSVQAFANSFSQLSSTLGSLTQDYSTFSAAMKAANTMAGKGAGDFAKLKGQVSELAREVPVTRDLLANGLYQVISNGVPEDDWISFLRDSARSATGGIADLNKVVGVTSTVIKNYGLEWNAAGAIQDKIQLTAKNGVTSFEQLSDALPQVTGTAATLGVSIDELMASFATLTGVSGNTAEVGTQLAAIFTALVKPGSEATKMAAEMGIQFDAAAIKASGGFEAFLQSLDRSIKAYSAASGVLEQEVYGKLFGSAESLRALVPLQGELAGKFSENVAAMKGSAGTMDAAFSEMASTGDAATRLMKNKFAELTDGVAALASQATPVINFSSAVLTSASSVVILAHGLAALNVSQKAAVLWQGILTAGTVLYHRTAITTTAVLRTLTAGFKGASAGATTLSVALRGMLAATGIGLAIWAIVEAVSYLTSKSDEATDATDRLADAERRAKEEGEKLEEMRRHEASTLEDLRSKLTQEIAMLKNFKGTQQEEISTVNRLNSTYGTTMGYFSSVQDWYKTLVANSEAYCKQMIIEARTRRLADQIAAKDQSIHDIAYDEYGNARKYSTAKKTQRKFTMVPAPNGEAYLTSEIVELPSDLERANTLIADERKKRSALQKQLDDAAKERAAIKMPVMGSKTNPNIPGGTSGDSGKNGKSGTGKNEPVWTKAPETLRQYQDNIDILNKKLQDATVESAVLINQQKQVFEKEADAIRNAGVETEKTGAKWHEHAATLKEVTDNLSVLNDQLQTATKDKAPEINRQIEQYEAMAEALRNAGRPGKESNKSLNKEAKTLKEITSNITCLQEELDNASVEEAASLNRQIALWEKKADAIRNAGAEGKDWGDAMGEAWNNVKGVAGGVKTLSGALDDNANAWERLSGLVDGFLQIFEGIRKVIDMIDTMTGTTHALTLAKSMENAATEQGTADVAANTGATMANTGAAVANTAAKSGEAVAGATASGAKLAFPFNLVAIAAGIAAVAGALALVGSFPTGGIVGGGSPSGDKLLARVNSGEMILNNQQQRRLFNLLDGKGTVRGVGAPELNVVKPSVADLRGALHGANSLNGATVRFEIDGRKLVGVIANETRIGSKSGRKTNIII